VTTSDDNKVSEDRREALRYALAIGSGAVEHVTIDPLGVEHQAIHVENHSGELHPRDFSPRQAG